MYYYLSGKLALCNTSLAVIDCGGVGYKCAISLNTYKIISKSENVKLFTFLNVKQDALDLYGFATEQELQFFTMLLTISGIGPRVSLALLSELLPEEFAACVISSDIQRLKKTPGVGLKMAQRICLELKDKISKLSKEIGDNDYISSENIDTGEDVFSESVSVLMVLGYSKSDASLAVKKCSADNTNDLVRQALRLLSKHL